MPSRECVRIQRNAIRFLSRRRAILIFVLCFFLWSTMFSFFWDNSNSHALVDTSSISGRNRLDNAKQYVAQLANRQNEVIDGPYTGRLTGYDTKKLLAVLLERLMSRLTNVEKAVSKQFNVSCGDQENEGCGSGGREHRNRTLRDRVVSYVDLLLGVQEQCNLDTDDLIDYPQCDEKVQWMSKFWKSHQCYRELGVDGSNCSFIIYLSEVEMFCPRLPSRLNLHQLNDSSSRLQIRTDIAPLLNTVLVDAKTHHHTFDFIRDRVTRMWPQWLTAARRHRAVGSRTTEKPQRRLRLHLHMGLLSRASNWRIAESSNKGGPLGELVQWADLIAVLYTVGHDLRVSTELEQLGSLTSINALLNSPCLAPSRNGLPDLIYTDLIGLTQLKRRLGQGYERIKCILRVLDTFGTQPQFNLRSYARRKRQLNPWGGRNLIPRQFFNLYPLTPDNSFLGFVIGESKRNSKPSNATFNIKAGGKEMALIYGKKAYMWKGMRAYLDVINEFFEVHATVADPNPQLVPSYVINHHFLNPNDFQQLLAKARVFVGLGFPFEGPAPLEAIAQGAVFINPQHKPPISRRNSQFFRTKPTNRQITSQHPYIERFIGEPYSYLVDMSDMDDVRRTLKRVLLHPRPSPGHIPLELTPTGMMERVVYYLRTQDFCEEQRHLNYGSGLSHRRSLRLWPPREAVQYFLGVLGSSCEKTCTRRKRVCEPAHFLQLNSVSAIRELAGLECDGVSYAEDHLAPFRRTDSNGAVSCVFQSQFLLFSCEGSATDVQRLCPCRDYKPQQSAICRSCET